jgi:hypothetical protein
MWRRENYSFPNRCRCQAAAEEQFETDTSLTGSFLERLFGINWSSTDSSLPVRFRAGLSLNII